MPPARPALPLPTLVAHADWGSQPAKRWVATARREAGAWRVGAPVHVDAPARLLARLRDEAGEGGAAIVGFDFPIGLPLAYARRACVRDFRALLPTLGGPFFEVAERPEEISVLRPFYPLRPGGAAQAQLAVALGVESFDALRRVCERARPGRAAAAPLFWTLGAQQVGKAALAGWSEVLIPALRSGAQDVVVWPFEGALAELLAPGRVVVAETYPAEFYTHLGVDFARPPEGGPSGKRVQKERAAQAAALLAAARAMGAALEPELERQLRDGFGARADGEDRFDACVGLLGVLNVVAGRRAAGEPRDPEVRRIEGWILGQGEAGPDA
jgi:hypothetical protein